MGRRRSCQWKLTREGKNGNDGCKTKKKLKTWRRRMMILKSKTRRWNKGKVSQSLTDSESFQPPTSRD
jgi:hypothetical protein